MPKNLNTPGSPDGESPDTGGYQPITLPPLEPQVTAEGIPPIVGQPTIQAAPIAPVVNTEPDIDAQPVVIKPPFSMKPAPTGTVTPAEFKNGIPAPFGNPKWKPNQDQQWKQVMVGSGGDPSKIDITTPAIAQGLSINSDKYFGGGVTNMQAYLNSQAMGPYMQLFYSWNTDRPAFKDKIDNGRKEYEQKNMWDKVGDPLSAFPTGIPSNYLSTLNLPANMDKTYVANELLTSIESKTELSLQQQGLLDLYKEFKNNLFGSRGIKTITRERFEKLYNKFSPILESYFSAADTLNKQGGGFDQDNAFRSRDAFNERYQSRLLQLDQANLMGTSVTNEVRSMSAHGDIDQAFSTMTGAIIKTYTNLKERYAAGNLPGYDETQMINDQDKFYSSLNNAFKMGQTPGKPTEDLFNWSWTQWLTLPTDIRQEAQDKGKAYFFKNFDGALTQEIENSPLTPEILDKAKLVFGFDTQDYKKLTNKIVGIKSRAVLVKADPESQYFWSIKEMDKAPESFDKQATAMTAKLEDYFDLKDEVAGLSEATGLSKETLQTMVYSIIPDRFDTNVLGHEATREDIPQIIDKQREWFATNAITSAGMNAPSPLAAVQSLLGTYQTIGKDPKMLQELKDNDLDGMNGSSFRTQIRDALKTDPNIKEFEEGIDNKDFTRAYRAWVIIVNTAPALRAYYNMLNKNNPQYKMESQLRNVETSERTEKYYANKGTAKVAPAAVKIKYTDEQRQKIYAMKVPSIEQLDKIYAYLYSKAFTIIPTTVPIQTTKPVLTKQATNFMDNLKKAFPIKEK